MDVDLSEPDGQRFDGCSELGSPVLQRQAPGPALADWIRALTAQGRDQLAERARAQAGERGYPGRLRRCDHTSHRKIIPRSISSYGTALWRCLSRGKLTGPDLSPQASSSPNPLHRPSGECMPSMLQPLFVNYQLSKGGRAIPSAT